MVQMYILLIFVSRGGQNILLAGNWLYGRKMAAKTTHFDSFLICIFIFAHLDGLNSQSHLGMKNQDG